MKDEEETVQLNFQIESQNILQSFREKLCFFFKRILVFCHSTSSALLATASCSESDQQIGVTFTAKCSYQNGLSY